jgi:hypothetical protein
MIQANSPFPRHFQLIVPVAVALFLSACGSQSSAPNNRNSYGVIAHTQSESALPVQSSGSLSSLQLSEPSAVGGDSTEVTLSMAQPAPAGGAEILLSSSDPAVSLPSKVEIKAGQTSATFTVSTNAVSAAVAVTIQAHYQNSAAGVNLALLPPATAPFSVSVLPAAVTVQQGKSGSAKATTKVNAGFDHSLELKVSGEPVGATLSMNPQTIPAPGSGTSALSISVGTNTQSGSYPLTVTASEGAYAASAKTTLNVISGTTNPDAKFKGCWYRQGGRRYQGVDVSVGKPGVYPFNAVLYRGATCNPNDFADQFGFGQLIQFGGFGYTFWFTDFSDQTDMSALWYVGDENSKCVSYATAPNC